MTTGSTNRTLIIGLSFTAGAGLILMILALGIGVVEGEAANGSAIGLTFAAGLALLILGVGAWLAVVRPFDHFDDINQPQYTGHHAEHHGEALDEHVSDEAAMHGEEVGIIPHSS